MHAFLEPRSELVVEEEVEAASEVALVEGARALLLQSLDDFEVGGGNWRSEGQGETNSSLSRHHVPFGPKL